MTPSTIIIMGVSGCGKSTVAARLAQRQHWLERIAANIRSVKVGHTLVISCSALKRAYRDTLRGADPEILFVYLAGTRAELTERLAARRHHFMPVSLLESQLHILEEPDGDERSMRCPISMELEEIVALIVGATDA